MLWSLAQPPAQSWVSYAIRPRVSGLDPDIFWKPLRTEPVQTLWATRSDAKLSSWGKFFLIPSWNLSCSHLCVLPLILPPCTSVKRLPPPSWYPPCRHWKAAVRSYWSLFFSKLNKYTSLILLPHGTCSSTRTSRGPSAEPTSVDQHLSCIGGPQTGPNILDVI